MAVLARVLIGSGERLDATDFLSIDSYTAADFQYLVKSFIGSDKPYVLYGFDVIDPANSIGTETVSIRVANSVVYHPTSQAGSFFYGLPEGNIHATPVVPELRKNATNFVYLTISTFDTAKDSRAFWDVDQNGGAGGEFSQDVNTETALKVEVGVSVSTFPDGTIPICKIAVGSSVITSIQDCRDQMFRLGSGGASPNALSTYSFRNEPSSTYARNETPSTMTSSLNPNPFQGGDKNIRTLKEWMDVVMTRIKEISGSTYWYQGLSSGSSGPNVSNIFLDALGSTIKSKGEWQHSSSVPGEATWSEDIHYYSLADARDLIIRANTITLASDDQVAWIDLKREASFNGSSSSVNWLNGAAYVEGITGAFANLSKGDWVKKPSDSADKFLRTEEFYALPGLAGGTTTAALAQSIRLSGAYAGTTGSEEGSYTKGEFNLSDINITDRTDASILAAGGNFFWLAYRSDTSLGLSSASAVTLSVDITEADGERARCDATGHGLVTGDHITITTGSYVGTYQVEVETANIFFISTSITGNELGQTAYYALVDTAARNTGYSFALESANHGFKSGETAKIAGTSSLFDGSYTVNVRSATQFQIPMSSAPVAIGPISGEIVSLVRLNVRTEFGTVKVVQGETVNIGDMDSQNILTYVGMTSLAQAIPAYATPINYNALNGHENYNSDINDSLTTRVSKLTAMMADRVQDRGMFIVGRTNITSVTSGLNQEVSALSNLTLKKPSASDQTILMTSPIVIPANSVAYVDVDRDGSANLTPIVESLGNNALIGENKIILFYRFSDTTVYTWQGEEIAPSGHVNTHNPEEAQNKNAFVFNPGSTVLDAISGLVTLDVGQSAEITEVTVNSGALVPQSSYFTFHSANDATNYYVWYNVDAGGIDPVVLGYTGIQVAISSGDSAATVASSTVTQINITAAADVVASSLSDVVTITNNLVGTTTDTADGATNTNFTFATVVDGNNPDIYILIPGSATNTISVDTINALGTLVLADGQSAWVRINRFAAKTFNTILTSDIPDTDVSGAIYITNTDSVPIDQDVMVLWTRIFNQIAETHKSQRQDGNVYDETLGIVVGVPMNGYELQGPVVTNTTISLPNDSRDSGSVQKYVVGAGQLELFLNGQYLRLGIDWEEVGYNNLPSHKIKIKQDLVVGDSLTFRIDANGAVFFASGAGGGGGSLQDAYDTGRFIAVTVGQPIVVTGASGKLMSIQGDLEVTGVVDPQGMTFSLEGADPLGGTDHGLWVNTSGELVFKRGVSTAINLVNDYVRVDGASPLLANMDAGGFRLTNLGDPVDPQDALTLSYFNDPANQPARFISATNNTGSSIAAGKVVRLSTSVAGEIQLSDASALSTVEGTVGVVYATIADGASGYVQVSGEATVSGLPLLIGHRVYVSTSAGDATSIAPSNSSEAVSVIGIAKTTTTVVLSTYLDTVNDNVYSEKILIVTSGAVGDNELDGPVLTNTIISLPLDSNDGDSLQEYVVGTNHLEIYLNGQFMEKDSDWQEVGTIGTSSSSIEILRQLEVDDELLIRIPLSGSAYYMVSGGGSGTLQDAYNLGQTITVSSGFPITINGPASEKLFVVNGDITVTGIIDPTAIQFTAQGSNPFPGGQSGLWINNAHELVYYNSLVDSTNNISDVVSGTGPAAIVNLPFVNGSGNVINAFTPVRINSSGEMDIIDVSVEASANAAIGVAETLISNGQTGNAITSGIIKNITTSASFGDVLYVSKSGGLTSTKPSVGVESFVSGDFVIRIGVVSKNSVTPTNKDLVVGVQIVGQL